MIKAVIFDYGGVLKEPHGLYVDIADLYKLPKEYVSSKREEAKPVMELFDKGLLSEEDFWEKVSKILGHPIPKDITKTVREVMRETYKKDFAFFPEMLEFNKELRARGIKTAVLSNILIFQAEVIREKEGYKDFDAVILSYQEGLRKPGDLDFYHLAPKRLGVKPEECIFIDDKEENLPPAQSIGIKTVLFKNSQQAIKEILEIIKK
ncbi:MAG: HAD family phosphatase [Candidatus Staskawiczbacteria bacterium]|jgi:putative hydrolase of the HAD superfamily